MYGEGEMKKIRTEVGTLGLRTNEAHFPINYRVRSLGREENRRTLASTPQGAETLWALPIVLLQKSRELMRVN